MRMHALKACKFRDVGLVFKLAVLGHGHDCEASASTAILV